MTNCSLRRRLLACDIHLVPLSQVCERASARARERERKIGCMYTVPNRERQTTRELVYVCVRRAERCSDTHGTMFR